MKICFTHRFKILTNQQIRAIILLSKLKVNLWELDLEGQLEMQIKLHGQDIHDANQENHS